MNAAAQNIAPSSEARAFLDRNHGLLIDGQSVPAASGETTEIFDPATEQRLARVLLQRADADGKVAATHHELAVAIGSVREVVSRRLEAFGAGGLVETVRGQIRLADRIALAALAASET